VLQIASKHTAGPTGGASIRARLGLVKGVDVATPSLPRGPSADDHVARADDGSRDLPLHRLDADIPGPGDAGLERLDGPFESDVAGPGHRGGHVAPFPARDLDVAGAGDLHVHGPATNGRGPDIARASDAGVERTGHGLDPDIPGTGRAQGRP